MTARVVDASVAIKWLVTEEYSDDAVLLITSGDRLIGPDILPIEISRAILRKVRRDELPASEARGLAVFAMARKIELHPSMPLLARAIDISLTHQRDPYDGLYLALALQERATLVTADRVMYNALVRPYPDTMVWVGDLPQLLGTQASPT